MSLFKVSINEKTEKQLVKYKVSSWRVKPRNHTDRNHTIEPRLDAVGEHRFQVKGDDLAEMGNRIRGTVGIPASWFIFQTRGAGWGFGNTRSSLPWPKWKDGAGYYEFPWITGAFGGNTVDETFLSRRVWTLSWSSQGEKENSQPFWGMFGLGKTCLFICPHQPSINNYSLTRESLQGVVAFNKHPYWSLLGKDPHKKITSSVEKESKRRKK